MISLNYYKNKYIAVVGGGATGLSVVNALKNVEADVVLLDDKVINHECYKSIDEVNWNLLDAVVVSPGIHLLWDTNEAVQQAHKFSVPIITDIDMLQQHISESSKIIAITGTNGKSTTTALIHHILNFGKYHAEIGGNFGTPVLNLKDNSDFYVLELSSYQLEGCNILGFDTAILLNITPDHLTRHGGMSGYISAKQKIFANSRPNSVSVISVDDEYCAHLLDLVKLPNVIKISGLVVPEGGIGWENNRLVDDRNFKHEIVCENYPKLDGPHNRQNIAAAYAASVANGINKDTFVKRLFSFNGLEHRQELAKIINDVQYVNDSKATNADSVKQALVRYNNIVWILGGRPKEDGIESLIPYFSKIKYAFLIGEAAEDWHQLLSAHNVKNEIVYTLDRAVQKSYEVAKKGDIVLLSPACASFDQFKSFEDRGEKFKKMVESLPC